MQVESIKDRPFIRLYTDKNIKLFKNSIATEITKINETLNSENTINVNEIYKRFYEKMHVLLNLYFPKVRQSRKKAKDKDWITDGIKRSIKQKHVLFKIQLTNSTTENREMEKI